MPSLWPVLRVHRVNLKICGFGQSRPGHTAVLKPDPNCLSHLQAHGITIPTERREHGSRCRHRHTGAALVLAQYLNLAWTNEDDSSVKVFPGRRLATTIRQGQHALRCERQAVQKGKGQERGCVCYRAYCEWHLTSEAAPCLPDAALLKFSRHFLRCFQDPDLRPALGKAFFGNSLSKDCAGYATGIPANDHFKEIG